MQEIVAGIKVRFLKRRREIVLTVAWVAAVATLIIATHRNFYLANVRFSHYNVPYLFHSGPAFTDLARVLLLAVGFLIGAFITDVKRLIYSYFTTMVFSSLIGVGYVYYYIWYSLGIGKNLSQIAFGWELALFWAVVNVFRIMFPFGVVLSLVGFVVGTIVRVWISP